MYKPFTLMAFCKRLKKMQWTREGAHNVLQIRTSIFNKTWNEDWAKVKACMYRNTYTFQ